MLKLEGNKALWAMFATVALMFGCTGSGAPFDTTTQSIFFETQAIVPAVPGSSTTR
ncbi:MAG: hypothetical protein HC813_00025 [Planctomycetes bacterium]|nr:hypothetical protein [Planctomycetota bacterium]